MALAHENNPGMQLCPSGVGDGLIGRGKAETTKNYESHRGIRLELVNLIDQVKGPIDEALEEGHRAHQLVVAEQQVAKAAEDAATN